MNITEWLDRTHLLRDGRPTTVTVIKEEGEWQDDDGRICYSCNIEKALAAGWDCVGVRLHLLEFPGQYLELNDDEHRYYEYVGPVLRLYPSKDDITGVEIF